MIYDSWSSSKMQIPLSWLKEFVEIDIPPELLAEKLTTAGLEVGAITYIGVPQTDPATIREQHDVNLRYPKSNHLVWDKTRLLWGAVHEVKPHPGADRLVLAMVDYGAAELEQCVTGAPNLFEFKGLGPLPAPLYTVIALEGAEVWDGHSDEPKRMILKEKPLRGIPNRSMVCSDKELGISDEHEGIMLFRSDLGHKPGTPATDVLGDVVFTIELTPNLARCYSVLGVAREIAALLDKPLRTPDYSVIANGTPIEGVVNVEIRSPKHTPRFTLMLLHGTELKPSPDWMQRKLKLCGQRPINNIVDVTNYVMFEMGQPLHAFDYDKLKARADGGMPKLITRLAEKGEILKTLDGKERPLAETDIVIADNRDIAISLSAVMGGFDTEIGDDTRNVLLEAANWDFISVRRTMHAQKLFSEAGTRFSRGVHPAQAALGVQRGIELMRQVGGGEVAKGMIDAYPLPAPVIQHTLTTAEIERIMGMPFTRDEAAALLRRGGFTVDAQGDALRVTVPDTRLDIDRDKVIGEADLIEEIARISGYERIPTTIIADEMPKQHPNPSLEREEQARDLLVALGLRENISYRMTTPEREAQLVPAGMMPGFETSAESYVRLANPISAEKTALRHTLLVNLLENAASSARYADRIGIFEIGNVYLRRAGQPLPDEPRRLGLLMVGARSVVSWVGGESSGVDFYDLKGVVEGLVAGLHLPDVSYARAEHSSFHPGRSAALHIGGRSAGVFGELHPRVAAAFGFPENVVLAAELDLDLMLAEAKTLHRVRSLPITPSVYQDVALVVRDEVSAAEVERVIRMIGGKLLRSVHLFDVYTGEPVQAGHRSLAYALAYGTDERTMNDKEVAALHAKIVKACERELGAVLRA
jgi:phenylalanyl-tRNA synthetase beta chain